MPHLIDYEVNCSFEASYPGPLYKKTELTRKTPDLWEKEIRKVLGFNNLKVIKIKEISQDLFLELRELSQFWNRENFDSYNEITKKYE